ncbi:MAG: alpha/beta fold hydrolase [Clostridiaceae bacterium]|nr:alpha/beta fold hydrolase [Clostridiaceae bacterium]
MGSPTQFSDFMDLAYGKGFSVVSLLLPGHGKSGFSFARSTLGSWEKYLDNQLMRFSSYKEIYLVGHSLGGLLAVNASLEFDIEGVVLISSPLKINILQAEAASKKIRLLFSKVEQEIRQAYREAHSIGKPYFISMPFWFRVLCQPLKLMRKTKQNLPKVGVPTLVIHSEADETASFESSAMFDELLLNSEHEMILLKESWHAYFTKEEKEIIYTKISDFISLE